MNFKDVFQSIFALLLIIWLANVLLSKLSQYTQGQSKTIQVIERFSVSKNSSLAIVKIVNQFYLMSFNEDRNEIVKEFTANEVTELLDMMQEKQKENDAHSFMAIDFTKMKEKYAKYFKKDQNK